MVNIAEEVKAYKAAEKRYKSGYIPVTCIVPCHNHADTIVRAVESAIDQCDYVRVSFDACTDNSVEVLEELYDFKKPYSSKFQFTMTDTHSLPVGVCHARNLAITRERGLILPLDADDWLVEGAVQKLKDAYKPGHFVYGNWYEVQDDKQEEQRPPPISMIRTKNIGYASFMYAKTDWQIAGGYLPHFNIGGEHWGFMASLIYKAKVRPIYIDTPLFYYNRGAGKRYGRANRFHSTIQSLVGEVIDGKT